MRNENWSLLSRWVSNVSAAEDALLKIWDAVSGAELNTLKGHQSWVVACTYSPDGKNIASSCWDKTIKIWDAESGSQLLSLVHPTYVNDWAYSPDGSKIVAAVSDKTLRIWDVATGK